MGPSISSLDPTSGPAGLAYPIQIVIIGRGFAESGNTVSFGDIEIPDLPSTDGGTKISFMAPKQNPPTGEAPPMVLLPGTYRITVTSAGRTSQPATFELRRGGLDRG